MKRLIVLIGLLAVAGCDRMPGPARTAAQQVAQIEQAVAHFPKGGRYYDLRYNVEKTDSLLNPVIAYIDMSEVDGVDRRFLFHWIDGKWKFQRAYTTIGAEFEPEGPGMVEYLAQYGYRASVHTPPVAANASPTPASIQLVTPPPRATPIPILSAEQQRAAILQKYGAGK